MNYTGRQFSGADLQRTITAKAHEAADKCTIAVDLRVVQRCVLRNAFAIPVRSNNKNRLNRNVFQVKSINCTLNQCWAYST